MSRISTQRQHERTEWLGRAEAIHAVLADYTAESIRLRTLAPASVDALEESGMFAISGAEEVGGDALHPATQMEVFAELTRADVSAGWCAMIQSMTTGLVSAHLSDDALNEVFGPSYPRVAGTANPEGEARRCDGGQRLNGRWSFASGVRHCNWVLAGARQLDRDGEPLLTESGAPRIHAVVAPTGALDLEDSWHVMGLQGTGSSHYRMHDVFVPEAFAMPFGGPSPQRGSAWFDVPTITFLCPGHAGVPLGAAQRALELLRDAATRTRFGTTTAIADRGAFQRDFGIASHRWEAARAHAIEALEWAMAKREAGEPITLADDARLRGMVAWVTDTCVEIVRFAHHSLGGAANFEEHPLQQILRDIQAASQHIFVADLAYERSGAAWLEHPPRGAL